MFFRQNRRAVVNLLGKEQQEFCCLKERKSKNNALKDFWCPMLFLMAYLRACDDWELDRYKTKSPYQSIEINKDFKLRLFKDSNLGPTD